ncbi:sugar phosphate isomerase/epimerase [Planktomarina temperata]|nr:sugar phosphate isomerase/epimerase [Planktomarina temperata]
MTSIFTREYGFSQGRLTVPPQGQLQYFPQEDWRDELVNAGLLGCSFVELLVERQRNLSNPIWSISGRKEITDLCKANGLRPYSVCLDYIIDHSILDPIDNSGMRSVEECITVACELGAEILVLPLLEASAVTVDNMPSMVKAAQRMGNLALKHGIILCVETLLSADVLNDFVNTIDMPNVKVVFDTGNRVLETASLKDDIIKLGKNISHLHMKDKNCSGENVVLGSGMVDFCGVFEGLFEIDYQGALNFETNRGAIPLDTARFNLMLCEFFVQNAKSAMAPKL